MATVHPRYPVAESAGTLARRATLGIGVAVIAVLLGQALVAALALNVGPSGSMSPFTAGPLIGTTVVAGAAASIVYAGLVRFTGSPVRNFAAVSVVVFTLQLLPVVVVAPSLGVTPVGQAVLVVYHVLVAVPIVAFVTGAVQR